MEKARYRTAREKERAMTRKHAAWSLVVCLVLSFIISCAPAQQKPEVNVVWPLPPDEPRVKFVDIFWSSLDLKKQPGVAETIFGAEKVEGFTKPYGIAVDHQSRVYVTDVGRVMVFDLPNKNFFSIGIEPGVGQLRVPIGVAVAPDGRLFVTDVAADRVFIYQNGRYINAIGESGELESPSGLCIDKKNELLYVVDSRKHLVNAYSLSQYKLVRTIGSRGDGDGKFNFPTNIAVDAAGNIYVVDTGNFRVQVFDAEGNFKRAFGKLGDTPGSLARPKGIGLDAEGHIYVADAAFQNFQIFDQEGNILLFVGESGFGPGKFNLPAGLTIDQDDRIYVVDQVPGSFQIFQYLGEKWKSRQQGK